MINTMFIDPSIWALTICTLSLFPFRTQLGALVNGLGLLIIMPWVSHRRAILPPLKKREIKKDLGLTPRSLSSN